MGTVWDRATEFLGDNIAVITPVAVGLLFVPASINDAVTPLADDNPDLKIVIGVIGLITAIISILGQLAITALALDLARSAGAAVAAGARQLLYAILITVLLLGAIVAGLLPVAGIIASTGVDMALIVTNDQAAIRQAFANISPLFGWVIIGYFLLWLIGSIWAAARLTLVVPALMEERKGVGSMVRSWRLTRGLALKIVGVLVLYAVVSGVAALAAKTAFGGVFGLIAGGAAPGSAAAVLTSVAVGAVTTSFAVLQAVFVAKLYVAACSRSREADGGQ